MIRNLVFLLLAIQTTIFSKPVMFESPRMGDSALSRVKIQIQPPLIPTIVRVWIKNVEQSRVIWRGKLTPKNNYTLTPNISRLNIGAYHIEAVYYHQEQEIHGKVVFWVDDQQL